MQLSDRIAALVLDNVFLCVVICNDNTWLVSLWSPHHLEWAQPRFTSHLSFNCSGRLHQWGLLFTVVSRESLFMYFLLHAKFIFIILIIFCIYCTVGKNVMSRWKTCQTLQYTIRMLCMKKYKDFDWKFDYLIRLSKIIKQK